MRRKSTLLATTLAVFFAVPVSGQEKGTLPGQSYGKGQDGEKQKTPVLITLRNGSEAKILDAEGQVLGHAPAHVIQRSTGRVLYAVVQGKGDHEQRLVPYHRFRWNADMKRLELPLTADRLGALPIFEPENLQQLIEPKAGEIVKGASDAPAHPVEAEPREAGHERGVELKNLLSSEIMSAEILAEGSSFGAISALVLEPKQGTIPFILVHSSSASSGKAIVVPWAAMERNEDGAFELSRSAQEMIGAPEIDARELGRLGDPATWKSIHEFYGVSQPAPPPMAKGAR